MYRFVVFFALALAALAAIPEEFKECIEPMKYPPQCCKTYKRKDPMDEDTYKECMNIPHAPGSCERDICIATKKGIMSSDGSIKLDALENDLEKLVTDNKDLLEVIKKKCIRGDYENHGEPDDCALRKMKNCIHWQVKWGCTDFSDEGQCKGIKEVAKKCMEFDS